MRQFTFNPRGVCSVQMQFELDDDNVIHNVRIIGGCPGNTLAMATLAENQPAADVIQKLKGIDCRGRGTSCPDQFATALEKALQS